MLFFSFYENFIKRLRNACCYIHTQDGHKIIFFFYAKRPQISFPYHDIFYEYFGTSTISIFFSIKNLKLLILPHKNT